MFDLKLLDHDIFHPRHEDEATTYHNVIARMEEAGIEYPSFVTFEEPPVAHRLTFSDGLFHLSELSETFKTFKEAHAYVKWLKHQMVFDDSIFDSGQLVDQIVGVSIVGEERPGTSGRIYLDYNDPRILEYNHYLSWLNHTVRDYLETPQDFLAAYSFLDHHPAFWHQPRPEQYPHQWQTDSAISKMWIAPTSNAKGELVFMMECGATVPGTNHHYHDLKLDVYAPSYNDAIIQTAALVHKFFDVDGSERPDVAYEKSDLEKLLDERMESYQKAVEDGNLITEVDIP